MDSTEPVEVLHMSKEIMQEGVRYLREFSFMSDHQVFTRVSRQMQDDDSWENRGWRKVDKDWQDLKAIAQMVEVQEKKGWKAEWNPAHSPVLKEFRVSVSFQ